MNTSLATNIIAICRLKVQHREILKNGKPKVSLSGTDLSTLSPDKEFFHQEDEFELKYLNQIDLAQISLSQQDPSKQQIDKFFLRKNFAMALTKKKEPLYWGDIIEGTAIKGSEEETASLGQQFIDVISTADTQIDQSQDYQQESLRKPTHLCKRLLCKACYDDNLNHIVFKNIRITDICCNDFAVHFLSEDGMMYSMGKDTKKYGILGQGSQYEMTSPAPNNHLIDFRISKISMGLSHCCALTSGGQLYSWGTGQNGQLCLQDSDTMFTNVPKLVTKSKSMHISNVFCSNYFTLILNSKGQVSLYGTLKGFAKFLFDSPSRDTGIGSANTSKASVEKSFSKFKLVLKDNESVTKLSIAEKAFAAYSQDTHNLYFVNDDLEVECILKRELNSFQFLNGHKYIVAQDKNNILIVLSQTENDNDQRLSAQSKQTSKHTWSVVKEFNLIQEFNSVDIELLPQDTSICTKKAQSLQLLTFITNPYQKKAQPKPQPVIHQITNKYFKTFLTQHSNMVQSHQQHMNSLMQSSNYSEDYQNELKGGLPQNNNYNKRQCQSPYASINGGESARTRNKLQLKLDSLFQSAFSAKKNGNRSTSIKERAKRLHQSLSPVQRFPIINNLCEIIKQHQINHAKGDIHTRSPSKLVDFQQQQQTLNQSMNQTPFNINNENKNYGMKSPNHHFLFQSLNLAYQLTSLGTRVSTDGNGLNQSQKQLQFLSKADRIRQDLNKKVKLVSDPSSTQQEILKLGLQQASSTTMNAGANDLIEIASPDASRNDQSQNICFSNMPLQITQPVVQQPAPQVKVPLQEKNLSCILEDKENSTVLQLQGGTLGSNMNVNTENQPKLINLKQRVRQQSLNLPQKKLTEPITTHKDKSNKQDLLYIDTLSEISGCVGRDSFNKFSQVNSIATNTNNYKILVMNARNVIEKKLLQCLMVGFNAIKYNYQQEKQSEIYQSFQLKSEIDSPDKQNEIIQKARDEERIMQMEQGAALLWSTLSTLKANQLFKTLQTVEQFSKSIQSKRKATKKLGQIIRQKQEQLLLESMRKIQLSIRFKKLQRLNISLLFNCFGKLMKRQQKSDLQWSFGELVEHFFCAKKIQAVKKMQSLLQTHQKSRFFQTFQQNAKYRAAFLAGMKLLRKSQTSIQSRKNLNSKSQALYSFKKNLINFHESRSTRLQEIVHLMSSRKSFKIWQKANQKRKAAIQQALFLKIFISNKLKQNMYNAIVKLINFSNTVHSTDTSKHSPQAQLSQEILRYELLPQSVGIIQNLVHPDLNPKIPSMPVAQIKFEAQKKELVERSIQNDYQDLDIEDTQMEEGDGGTSKRQTRTNYRPDELPRLKGEFSFDKNEFEFGAGLANENNMTAHFNKIRGVTSSSCFKQQMLGASNFPQYQKSEYHSHNLIQDQENYIIEPSSSQYNRVTPLVHHSRQNSSQTYSIPVPQTPQEFAIENKENYREERQNYSSFHQQFQQQTVTTNTKMKMSLQNEISPTNNCKNYQRQIQLNKNYEQADPFELPMDLAEIRDFGNRQGSDMSYPDYAQFIDKELESSVEFNFNKSRVEIPRQSFTQVVPFNPPDDTPMETCLRNKQQLQHPNQAKNKLVSNSQQNTNNQNLQIPNQNQQQQVFQSKKASNASSTVGSSCNSNLKTPFINNYFLKLSAQNSAKQESSNRPSQPSLPQSANQRDFREVPKQPNNIPISNHQNQANRLSNNLQKAPNISQNQNQAQQNSTSFVTNPNQIDLMHFHSNQSDSTSFVFFDDNFWRESGVSQASRFTHMTRGAGGANQGQTGAQNNGQPGILAQMANQSFGMNRLSNQNQQMLQQKLKGTGQSANGYTTQRN